MQYVLHIKYYQILAEHVAGHVGLPLVLSIRYSIEYNHI